MQRLPGVNATNAALSILLRLLRYGSSCVGREPEDLRAMFLTIRVSSCREAERRQVDELVGRFAVAKALHKT